MASVSKDRRGSPLFVILVLVASALLIAVGVLVQRHVRGLDREKSARGATQVAAPVRVVQVERRVLLDQAAIHGFLTPYVALAVSADVPGEIVEQWVDVADELERGKAMFKIDDAVRTIEHDEALAMLDQAEQDCELAKTNWDRLKGLDEQQTALIERKQGEIKYLAAKARKHQAEAAVRLAALMLDRTTVTSPIDGVVSRIHLRRGEYAQPGHPLAEVIEVDRLKLLAEVEDRNVVWIEVGQPAVLTTKALPGESFEGVVRRVHPQAVLTSRKFDVEIELPNPGRRLHPGFFMDGTITRAPGAGVDTVAHHILAIPREAVVELFGQTFCYVVQPRDPGGDSAGGIFLARRVAIDVLPVLSDPRSYRVVSGVEEGAMVVTKGLQHLSEQTEVRLED